MNYGKTAYLKVLDIEKELTLNQGTNSNLTYYENSKSNINENISENHTYSLSLDNITVTKDKSVCFQVKISLTSNTLSDVTFELLANDCIIHNESKVISSNQSDVLLIKTYTPLTTGVMNVGLNIHNQTEGSYVTIDNITTIIIGAEGESNNLHLELRAVKIPNENNIIISYIDNNELYYTKTSLNEKSLRNDDFTYLMPAISHSFCIENYPTTETETVDIILYRVDTNKKLYYSKVFNDNIDVLIDEEVDVVHAHACPLVSDDLNIIAYIKKGKCYFRTMRSGTISNEKELALPTGTYKDIQVISKEDSEHIYIVATHENGSNYILHSLVEVSTGTITEFLYASYSLVVTKYIDLSFAEKLYTELIKVDIDYSVVPYSKLNETIEKAATGTISATIELYAENYEIESNVIYGVRLDKAILTGKDWGTYTDDSLGFDAAYMDFDNDIFVDNGWTERWPFNEIKPCLLKDGKVLGYLNPNNFTEFIDGTVPDTTSADCGYIMIEIPKMYFSISRDEDYIDVKISSKAQDGFVCSPFVYKGEEHDKIYISAYLCGHQNFQTYGFKMPNESYVATTVTIGYSNSRYNILKNYDGERFEFLPYNVLKLLQCLYIIMFKNTDSQTSLGTGYSAEQTSHKVGLLNQKGMYYGTNTFSGGVKFMGLEDIYGCRGQLVTGFYVEPLADGTYSPRFIDPYDENMSYAPDQVSTYLASKLPFTKGSKYVRTAIDINEDANNIGFFASSNSTDKTIGFCDSGSLSESLTSFVDFGCTGNELSNGMFAQSTKIPNDATTKRSVRLVYYPQT